MEHPATSEELAILSQMDFIVPLKQFGLITRAVLEGVYEFYKPRRIILVTSEKERHIFYNLVVPYWSVGVIEFVPEETFFLPHLNLTLDQITAEYDNTRGPEQREVGWWVQQLVKLGAASQVDGISEHYVVWDGDLIPLRRWRLCAYNSSTNSIDYSIAILQENSRSAFNTQQYAQCMKTMTTYSPIEPTQGTMVAHHMVFNRTITLALLNHIQHTTRSQHIPWPLVIMSYTKKFYRFSEYKTYTTYIHHHHPDALRYHHLGMFGKGGVRVRGGEGGEEVVRNMVRWVGTGSGGRGEGVGRGGLSYDQVKQFMLHSCGVGASSCSSRGRANSIPGYIQLDHVYGLDEYMHVMSVKVPKAIATYTYRAALLGGVGAEKDQEASIEIKQQTEKNRLGADKVPDENKDFQPMARPQPPVAPVPTPTASTTDNLFVRVAVEKIRLKRPWVCAK